MANDKRGTGSWNKRPRNESDREANRKSDDAKPADTKSAHTKSGGATSPSPNPSGSRHGASSSERSTPKKPTPIIDLKATEVGDGPKSEQKSDNAKQASTSPSSTTGASATAAVPSVGATSQGAASNAGTASSKSANTRSATEKLSDKATATSSATTDQTAHAKKAREATEASKSSSGNGGERAKNTRDMPQNQPETTAAPVRTKKGSVAGGIWRTFTHLAAGVAGGALVLFGAEPLEKELKMKLLPRPGVPAEVNQRLAAVEARPVADVSSADVNKIAEEVTAVKGQMASLDTIQNDLAELGATVEQLKKIEDAQANAQPTSTLDAEAIQARLAKIEQTFETLTTAGANGSGNSDAAGLARLAEVSGKVADLEAALNTKVTALRETLTSGLEEQASQTANARAAARAGTRRVDRELSVIKTEAARLAQRAETLKAEQDTLTQAVGVAREETAKLSVALNTLTGSVSERFKSVARSADIENAIKPVSSEIAALKSQLSDVVKAEIARKTNAERIVMALELGNLKRVLDRGGPYDAELAEVKQMLGASVDLSALEKFQAEGVPSASQLSSEFGKLAYAIIRAETEKEDATMLDRLLGGAQSFVRIRRADVPTSDKSTEATVARIENRLKDGNLTGALAEAQKLPEKSVKPAQAWLDRVAARVGVDRAIATIERELKSSLSSQAGKKG